MTKLKILYNKVPIKQFLNSLSENEEIKQHEDNNIISSSSPEELSIVTDTVQEEVQSEKKREQPEDCVTTVKRKAEESNTDSEPPTKKTLKEESIVDDDGFELVLDSCCSSKPISHDVRGSESRSSLMVNQRASKPEPALMDYVVRPQSMTMIRPQTDQRRFHKVGGEVRAIGETRQRIEKKFKRIKANRKKSLQAFKPNASNSTAI